MELNGNPVCHKPKYRDKVILQSKCLGKIFKLQRLFFHFICIDLLSHRCISYNLGFKVITQVLNSTVFLWICCPQLKPSNPTCIQLCFLSILRPSKLQKQAILSYFMLISCCTNYTSIQLSDMFLKLSERCTVYYGISCTLIKPLYLKMRGANQFELP